MTRDRDVVSLPDKYHDAVVRWREHFLPDYDLLMENWERFFPKDEPFRLCAFRQCGMCGVIECGEDEGDPKFERAADMDEKRAHKLLGAIRAQASTEFGSIQQHQLTLARAQTEKDQFWTLRMMAEELRHGYQMFHLLSSDETWSDVAGVSTDDMIEEILSMKTGSHILGAFNIDYDSYVDSVTFCAIIDRVGKYQLSMQQVSAYQPMAESMPPMLQEEAFHLAAGVVPLRRWVQDAAEGEIYITMEQLQKALWKWIPRGLDMFGDERGGNTNVRLGFKPMDNATAQELFIEELQRLIDDLNVRYVRTRLPDLSAEEADELIEELERERGKVKGIEWETLLRQPDPSFFRRRGVHAFELRDVDGNELAGIDVYGDHLTEVLPGSYLAGRDFKDYWEVQKKVAAGEMTPKEGVRETPELRRVGGVCPCSRAVRWVEPEGNGHEKRNGNGAEETATPPTD